MSVLPHQYEPRVAGRVELTESLQRVSGTGSDQVIYGSAHLLVTIHAHPLGMLSIDIPPQGLEPTDIAAAINEQFSTEIEQHLLNDGLEPAALTGAGFTDFARPVESVPCWRGLPASADLPFVSIVIATKDRSEELERCLERLLNIDYPTFEIVVIDNGASDDRTKTVVDKFSDKNVRYFSLDIASASHARNLGVKEARGDIVAFTDDDVIVDPLWLKALVRGFNRFDNVACVTGLVIPASYDFQAQQWFEEYGGFNKGYKERVFGRRREAGLTVLYPYTAGVFGSGNNAAFLRKDILEVGGWDTNLGPGTPTRAGEDLDAFLAIILSGKRITYEPSAIIGHFHRDQYDALEKQLLNYGIGLTAVFAKWFLRSPRYGWEIVRRVPRGVWVVLSPKSAKNSKKSETFPKQLALAEIKGMLMGPFLYLKSKHR